MVFQSEKNAPRFRNLMLIMVAAALVIVALVSFPKVLRGRNSPEDIDAKVRTLVARMTLEEKIGQMVQAERASATPDDVKTYYLGSILSGGGSTPFPNTPKSWCDMIDAYQKAALSTRMKIPFIYGIDAVHGHNNAYGATVFPHNIGLGATRNPALIQEVGRITAEEVKATGIPWTFAPCVAVVQNEKWGRTYESFGENTDLVTRMGVAYTLGFQGDLSRGDLNSPGKIAACIKHYIGDGATQYGVDAADAVMTENEMREKYLPPYIAAIRNGARTVMISFNSINGLECHANRHLITDILKNEIKFDGFVISDWDGINDNDPADYRNSVKLAVNAGIDMLMVPNSWRYAIAMLKDLANSGEISTSRINDAVTRILRVKYQLGLFKHPYAVRGLMKTFGSEKHRAVAREAVRKSLVLLKNDKQILPLPKAGKKIFVAGKNADDIGNQCGGWTLTWQGKSGNEDSGTAVLTGIRKAVTKGTTVTYNKDGTGATGYDVAIVVIGETPYAEKAGDRVNLDLDTLDCATLENVKAAGVPMVVIMISGRPMIVTDQIGDWAAFVEAWLPGTEGDGVADVLFGDYDFTGKLPLNWPSYNEQLSVKPETGVQPLFPYGFGLSSKEIPSPLPVKSPKPLD